MLADLPHMPLRNKSAVGRLVSTSILLPCAPAMCLIEVCGIKQGESYSEQGGIFLYLGHPKSLLGQRSVLGCEQPW